MFGAGGEGVAGGRQIAVTIGRKHGAMVGGVDRERRCRRQVRVAEQGK